MGFSESDSSRCKKHTNQKQLPGICPSCLSEKLSKLSTTPHYPVTNHLISSPSPSSTTANAATRGRISTTSHLRRNGSQANATNGVVMLSGNGLKKSKSLSCAPLSKNRSYDGRNKNGVETCKVVLENDDDGKKKGGLLKRLMNSTSKKSKLSLVNSNSSSNRSSHHTATAVVVKKRNL